MTRFKVLLLLITIGSNLFHSCNERIDLQNRISILESGDSLIFLNGYFADYLHELNRDSDRINAYEEKVLRPIYNKYLSRSEDSTWVKNYLSDPVYKPKELEHSLFKINKHQEVIEKLIIESLRDSRGLLENGGLSIYIFPINNELKDVIELIEGVDGLASGSKQILLFIEPTIGEWEEKLKYTIAHEFHHLYWFKNNSLEPNNLTLLDALVVEGKADCFAQLLYPETKSPWTSAISKSRENALWNTVRENLASTDEQLHNEILFGSPNYPRWGGYTVGHNIVSEFLKNEPNESPERWTNLPSKTILAKSNYGKKTAANTMQN